MAAFSESSNRLSSKKTLSFGMSASIRLASRKWLRAELSFPAGAFSLRAAFISSTKPQRSETMLNTRS